MAAPKMKNAIDRVSPIQCAFLPESEPFVLRLAGLLTPPVNFGAFPLVSSTVAKIAEALSGRGYSCGYSPGFSPEFPFHLR